MKCGEEYGCASSIVRFVIPMGTNINRDGAALYEAVSVMFICQVHNLRGHLIPTNLFYNILRTQKENFLNSELNAQQCPVHIQYIILQSKEGIQI